MKTRLGLFVSILSCQFAHAQQVSPGGIYGAANTSAGGGISVSWVLGSLNATPELSVLPVVLVSFTGKLNAEGNAELTWQTAEETNNAGFEIQKSTDAKVFTRIGWIDGATNSKNENSYRYIDNDLQTTSYYRLKQMDLDGKSTLSRKITIIPEKEDVAYALAYPNPTADGRLTLRLPEKAVSLLITDQAGRVVLSQKSPVTNQSVQLPSAGTFIMKVETAIDSKALNIVNIK